MENNNKNGTGCLILFIIGIIVFILWKVLFSSSSTVFKNQKSKPTDIELMSYAQTVLDNNLNSPQYSSRTTEYKFTETGLRYKIEGEVIENGNRQKFWLIIRFLNDSYKEYDVISLQVGSRYIIK